MKKFSEIIGEGMKHKQFAKEMIYASLDFCGYFKEAPDVEEDGVYLAFARNIENPQPPSNYDLVYIGIGDIKSRIQAHISSDHQKWAEAGCYAPTQEEIVYSYAIFSYDSGLSEIEKVLVNQANPCYNSDYADGFESECISIHIECKGNKGGLKDSYNWINPKWYKD